MPVGRCSGRRTASGSGMLRRIAAPLPSTGTRRAARTQTALCLARADRDAFPRREGEFGLGEHAHRLARLRRQFAIFTDPARQEGLCSFRNPLLQQDSDLFAQVGGVVQTRKFKAFERRIGGFVQKVPRRSSSASSHDLNYHPPVKFPGRGLLTQAVIQGQIYISSLR